MKKITMEKLSMVQSVLDAITSQSDIIALPPALSAAMIQLETKKNEVQSILQAYFTSNVWKTIEKDKLLKVAIEQTAALAKVLRAYSKSVYDDNLYNRMRYSKSSLMKGGISSTLLGMKEVMDEAAVLLPNLSGFAYDNTKFASFTQRYADLQSRKVAPRNAIVDHKALGETLKQELKAIDDILAFQLDTIMMVLKPENEAFYSKYKSARKTIHHGKYGSKDVPPELDDGAAA